MERINLVDAKAWLNEIINRAEAGESIDLTGSGKPAARFTQPLPAKVKVDIAMLEELDKIIPMQKESAVDLVRRMRDSGY